MRVNNEENMKAINIEYDETLLDNPAVLETLPKEIEIPNHISRDNYASESDYYAAIADYISDKTGCPVKSYFTTGEETNDLV